MALLIVDYRTKAITIKYEITVLYVFLSVCLLGRDKSFLVSHHSLVAFDLLLHNFVQKTAKIHGFFCLS
jgi:hypothetical protein